MNTYTYLVKIYDSEAFRKNTGGTALVMFFHPHWIVGIASEPEYYLVFNLVRKESVENLFRRFKPAGPIDKFITNDNDLVKGWIGKDEYSDREYYLFQRNINIQNNKIVSAGAKLLHRPRINQQENLDIQVIRRMLNSIQPLPEE